MIDLHVNTLEIQERREAQCEKTKANICDPLCEN